MYVICIENKSKLNICIKPANVVTPTLENECTLTLFKNYDFVKKV